MTDSQPKAGFVAVIGAPNAGKSTLVNALVGQKVAIVSPKAQTTRSRLMGIAIEGAAQVLLVDTPGIFEPRRRLDRAMVAAAWTGAQDADLILLVIDSEIGVTGEVARIVDSLDERQHPLFLVLNKIDLVKKSTLLTLSNTFYHWGGIIVPPGYTDPIQFKSGTPYGTSRMANDDANADVIAQAARYQGSRVAEITAAERADASSGKPRADDRRVPRVGARHDRANVSAAVGPAVLVDREHDADVLPRGVERRVTEDRQLEEQPDQRDDDHRVLPPAEPEALGGRQPAPGRDVKDDGDQIDHARHERRRTEQLEQRVCALREGGEQRPQHKGRVDRDLGQDHAPNRIEEIDRRQPVAEGFHQGAVHHAR